MVNWLHGGIALAIVLTVQYQSCIGGAPKVSWKECNLEPAGRQDCGYRGISEEKCYKRGCCWTEERSSATPWCYYSKLMTSAKCAGPKGNRTDCGFYGIRKDQCLSLDCCWQPTNDRDVPWCYQHFELHIQGSCGEPAIPPRLGSSKVVGGVEAIPHSWPWQASLQVYTRHNCGASIINELWLVTAAHCEFEPMTVVVGMHSQTGSFTQKIEVEATFPHEQYGNITTLDSDIMLIKLSSPIQFSEEVSPVCLPEQNEEVEAGTKCYITGWGTTELHGAGSDTLQQAGLPVLRPETCQEWYTEPQNWYYETNETLPITPTMICAGYEEGGKSGCHGDSGGPFVCHVNGVWKLFGAVSWGGKCGYEKVASVFARVSYFRDWIQETFEKYS